MDSAVVVALVGLLGLAIGGLSAYIGKRMEARDKAVADRFAEIKTVADMRLVDLADCRTRNGALQEDLDGSEQENRRLRSDLAALAMVVHDEVMREAARTAHDIEQAEEQP